MALHPTARLHGRSGRGENRQAESKQTPSTEAAPSSSEPQQATTERQILRSLGQPLPRCRTRIKTAEYEVKLSLKQHSAPQV
eukprot:CAMPEP_0183597330 /NCGR_PEP_ID=MMETSP0371-20130417/176734_1 /TAXON_ID=268820 /ORGANISM="Peridinium aciculiferum, Strain PAER-2" /LENGTH=81 /DNA_ID=CAMNT_0025809285 /DNA_START=234 /DNA_END=477 /DNA_ORIENTATION=+